MTSTVIIISQQKALMKIMHADLQNGTIPTHKRWAGGQQSYLCATQAPHYVKRNFREIEKNQIHLDGAYLDVFTCNEGDECNNQDTA